MNLNAQKYSFLEQLLELEQERAKSKLQVLEQIQMKSRNIEEYIAEEGSRSKQNKRDKKKRKKKRKHHDTSSSESDSTRRDEKKKKRRSRSPHSLSPPHSSQESIPVENHDSSRTLEQLSSNKN